MIDAVCEKLRNGSKVIVVHSNADMDAIGSAYALMRGFGNAVIYAPKNVDRLSKNVLTKTDIPVLEQCDVSKYDTMVIVDTSSPEQLDVELDIPDDVVIVDHHMPTGRWETDYFLCDNGRASCCEVVKDLLDHAGIEIDRGMAIGLMCGMLTDSANFRFADHRTLGAFSELMAKHSIAMDEVMNLTDNPVTISERVAVMKGLGSVKFDRIGDYIVATAICGNYEASVAKAIMQSGADVALVASQRADQFRVSSRATQEIVRRGIHMGEIMNSLGKDTMTEGGGHSGAAGVSGTGDAEAMLFLCSKKVMEAFRQFRAEDLR
jgi:nanoRNase/pAp phosphatase (c-di-AMP/oligoRNAs hydrolase)